MKSGIAAVPETEIVRPRLLRTYVARLFTPDGTHLQTGLLRSFYNKEGAKRKLKSTLAKRGLAHREARSCSNAISSSFPDMRAGISPSFCRTHYANALLTSVI